MRLLKYAVGLGLFGLTWMMIGSSVYGKKQERLFPPLGDIVTINGVNIHFVDTGPIQSDNINKTPVLMIHGAATNLRDMKIALGDGIAKTRRVIMVDRAGHGYSARPKGGDQLAVQSGLIHDLAVHLGLGKPVILGQSYGGATALNYALQFPDDVSALILIAPVSHQWADGSIESYRKLAVHPLLGPMVRRSLMPIYGHFKGEETIRRAFEPQIMPKDYYHDAATPLLYRAKQFLYDSQDITALLPQIRTMSGQYQNLTMPVTIIAGLEDTSLSPKNHAVKLAEQITNSHLTLLPNIGHSAHHAALPLVQAELAIIDGLASLKE